MHEADVVDIVRAPGPDDFEPQAVKKGILEALGLRVELYDGGLPPGFEWGRVYRIDGRVAAVELIRQNLHYVAFQAWPAETIVLGGPVSEHGDRGQLPFPGGGQPCMSGVRRERKHAGA